MRYTRLGLFAALAVLAMPLAISAQALAGPSASPGTCHLAPSTTMQKTSVSGCNEPFVAGHAVIKVKTVERTNPGAGNVITNGDKKAATAYNPPADPVVEKVKSGGKSELASNEPVYIDRGSDRLYVCTGATEPTPFESVARAVSTELPLDRQPCQRRTSAQ